MALARSLGYCEGPDTTLDGRELWTVSLRLGGTRQGLPRPRFEGGGCTGPGAPHLLATVLSLLLVGLGLLCAVDGILLVQF